MSPTAGVSKSYTLDAGANGQQVLQTDGINIRGVWPCQVRMGSAGPGLKSGGRLWSERSWRVPCAPFFQWRAHTQLMYVCFQQLITLPFVHPLPLHPQDLIDCDRMSTNNPAAMLAAYGVEACRATIVKEVRIVVHSTWCAAAGRRQSCCRQCAAVGPSPMCCCASGRLPHNYRQGGALGCR